MSAVPIKINITLGECNGYMSSLWYVDNQLVADLSKHDLATCTVAFNAVLPCNIVVVVSGKNQNTDTMVQDGKIVQDKYIVITDMLVARLPVNKHTLYQICNYTKYNGQSINDIYWAWNGQATISLTESDAVLWHLKYNS
jgi:hypothetical protein